MLQRNMLQLLLSAIFFTVPSTSKENNNNEEEPDNYGVGQPDGNVMDMES